MKNIYKKGNYVIVEDLDVEKYPYSTVQIFPLNTLGVSTQSGNEIVTLYTSANSKVVFQIANPQLLVNGVSYGIDEVAEKLMDELTGSTGGGGGITPTSSDGSLTINGNDISVTWLKALEGTTEPLTLYVDENGFEHASIGGKNLATEEWVESQGYLKEHQPIKTINGESIIGEGDIEIKGGDIEWIYADPEFEWRDEYDCYVAKINDERLVRNTGKTYHLVIDWHKTAAGIGLTPDYCRIEINDTVAPVNAYHRDKDGNWMGSVYVDCNHFGVYNLYCPSRALWSLYDSNVIDYRYYPSRQEFEDVLGDINTILEEING